ncbi:MAG: helix-turn-helix transcriptional regulator [Oscillospiraceae bacterium]|nr:helix-turn-helix transcriptional regulator [Oscillospiraceae bacterium]
MTYETFQRLCIQAGITPYRVRKDLNFPSGMLSNWKAGRYSPKYDKQKAIAEYFGKSLDELNGSEFPMAAPQLREAAFNQRPELRVLFDLAEKMPAEDINWLIEKARKLKENE